MYVLLMVYGESFEKIEHVSGVLDDRPAALQIVDRLQEDGYEFGTVDEILFD